LLSATVVKTKKGHLFCSRISHKIKILFLPPLSH